MDRFVLALVLALGSTAFGLMLATSPALAQATTNARIEAIEQQMQLLQQELQRLKGELGNAGAQLEQSRNETRQAQEAARRAEEQAKSVAAKQPALSYPNGRPTLASPDGKASLAIGAQVQFDVGGYLQDRPAAGDTRLPVGARDLNDGENLRRGRLFFVGRYGDWSLNLTPDFGGSPDGSPTLYEANLNYSGIKPLTFTFGLFKPWLTLGDSMSSNDFLFLERPSIVEIAKNLAGGDARASFGVRAFEDQYFAAAYLTGGTYGDQTAALLNDEQKGVTGRIAARPLRGADWNLHVGASASHVFHFAQNTAAAGPRQTVQLRDRPELRIDNNRLIDTGVVSADGALTYGLELAASWRNFLIQGEYIRIDVDQRPTVTATVPDLGFRGGYVEASWVITGEERPYVPGNAAFGRPKPANPFSLSGGIGAWELALRYSIADLDSQVTRGVPAANTGGVYGGRQEIFGVGLSWYPIEQLRFMLDYSYVDVDRLAANGMTPVGQHFHTIAGRAQVAF